MGYIGVFLILMSAMIIGSRMYDSESGCLGEFPTWLPFAFATLGATLIVIRSVCFAVGNRNSDSRPGTGTTPGGGHQHGSHGPIMHHQSSSRWQGPDQNGHHPTYM